MKNNSFGELLNWPKGTGDAAAKMRSAQEALKQVTPKLPRESQEARGDSGDVEEVGGVL